MKWLMALMVLTIVLIAGCTQPTQYLCSDGSTVSSPNLCPSRTPVNGECQEPFVLQVDPQTGEARCVESGRPPMP